METVQEMEHRERPVGQLLRELRDETTDLFSEEVELAKTEMSKKIDHVTRNTIYLFSGGFVLFAGFLYLLMFCNALLYQGLLAAEFSQPVATWLSPLIVGTLVAIIGYFLMRSAINRLGSESVVPEQTVASMKSNAQWAKRRMQ